MIRITAMLCLLATPLAAQDKEMLCATSGEIVDLAVAERVGGADEGTAVKSVSAALPDDKAKFKPAVEPLVQWVYTLEAGQLTDDVAKSYIDACLAQ